MCASLVTRNCFPISSSRSISVRENSGTGPKDSKPRSGQKLGSNMHKTDSLPKESETSFVKFVRRGGRGIPVTSEKKAEVPEAARCLRVPDHGLGLFVHEL